TCRRAIARVHGAAAGRGAAGACEGGHLRAVERRIVHGDLLPRPDRTARDEVEPVEPRVGIAGVVDGAPRLGVIAPRHPDLVGEGPRIAGEPVLPALVPVPLDVALRDEHVRLLLVALNDFALRDRLRGEGAVVALTVGSDLPLRAAPGVPGERGGEDLLDEAGVAGGVVLEDEVGAAGVGGRVEDGAVR